MNYVGVDYHKRYSVATVVDEKGVVLARRRLNNRRDEFARFLKPFGKTKAAVEATRSWAVAVEILEQTADEVVLANPYRVKAIAQHRFKTDKIDSQVLAELVRIDWLPTAYLRDRANREQQLILRVRCFFVRMCTRLKNRIHDLIDRQSEEIRETAIGFSDLFGKKGLAWLRSLDLGHPCGTLLEKLLSAYEGLYKQVHESDKLVQELFDADPDCRRLATIPGIGKFFAVLIKTEVGDIERFPSAARLCSYAGVVPRTASSGGKVWHGPIIKQSNRWLRWALVEAAIPAKGHDPELRRLYDYHRRTKGPKTAKVVVGRRLGCIVYRVLRERKQYYTEQERARVQNGIAS